MNQDSKNQILSGAIFFLSLFVIVKLAWVGIEYFYLPKEGIDKKVSSVKKTLYYRYGLATDVEIVKPKTKTKPHKQTSTMSGMKLVAIYNEPLRSVVVIKKGSKSHVIATGESINGFVLQDTTPTEAYFKKSGKDYTLKLLKEKKRISSSMQNLVNISTSEPKQDNDNKNDISINGDTREIPKTMIKKYTSDFRSIVRDIGLRPVNQNGQLSGYMVRFIRHGSPMSKLGLKKGDIIKSINGEDIVDPSTPMSFLQKADKLEHLTITISRGNQEKDLEYEVK